MNVKELKEELKNIPDDVEIFISDMNGEDFDFSVGTYWDDAQTYLDFIIPIYIHAYNYEDSDEIIEVN